MDVGELTRVEQTALLTVYARALDSGSSRSILGDTLAAEVVDKIDYDFASLGATASVVCLVAVRAKMLDDRIRAFIATYPDPVVLDLGAGLSSAVYRVDPPQTVDWYSVDLPAMVSLRDAALPRRDGSHSLAASLAEPNWAKTIPADRPTLVFADGLFAFLDESVVIAILHHITDHFDSGVVAFNDYGPVSRANRFAGKLVTVGKQMLRGQDSASSPHSQWNFSGFKDARVPQSWNPALKLTEEASVFHEPETAVFPPLLRLASRMSARFPAIARKARILQYAF